MGMIRNWLNLYLAKKSVKPGYYVEIELATVDTYQGAEDEKSRLL
jgi:hypothetical protein